jgi:hypothetical protein
MTVSTITSFAIPNMFMVSIKEASYPFYQKFDFLEMNSL